MVYKTRFQVSNAGKCMWKNEQSITVDASGNFLKCYSLVETSRYTTKKANLIGSGKLCEEVCVYSSLCEGGCPYNQYIQGKWMSRDCQKSYLDFANKAIFSQEIFGDITFKEISKIKTLTVES